MKSIENVIINKRLITILTDKQIRAHGTVFCLLILSVEFNG